MPFVYYREECDLCKSNRFQVGKSLYDYCPYENDVRLARLKLEVLEKESKNVYGSFSFKCDYFVLDEETYYKRYPSEQKGHCCG